MEPAEFRFRRSHGCRWQADRDVRRRRVDGCAGHAVRLQACRARSSAWRQVLGRARAGKRADLLSKWPWRRRRSRCEKKLKQPMKRGRRHFLKTTAAAGLAFNAIPLLGAEPGRKYCTALIGTGWWGKTILKQAMKSERVKIVALCDVDESILDVAADQVNDLSGAQPKTYSDYRELLEKENAEIAIIATPDHWHALQTIAALKAGAHVFVEKPTGHTVKESCAMLHTARESGRVVQVDLHRRIGPHYVSGMKLLKSGAVGEIGMVRLFLDGSGGKENPKPNTPAPDTLDWNMWCGPAPLRPFN